jgi:HEAT repeat protein/predicted MFS family arabinose efflux permease
VIGTQTDCMNTHSPLTTVAKLRGLRWSIAANGTNSIFAQFTFFGPVFVLFLAELSISNTLIGFILSLVPFTGLVAIFIAQKVARFGYKRTFIVFWGARKGFATLLILVPWVSVQFGELAAVILVTVIMAGFSLCRSVSETGFYPWQQEFVPDNVRGKYSASNTIVSNIVSIIAVVVATFVLGLSTGMDRFIFLFAIGSIAGFIAVWLYTKVPGGAPDTNLDATQSSFSSLLIAAKDRNLQLYLAGILLFTLGTGPLYSFLPLFMQDPIGLSESGILALQISVLIGGLISSQLLGWSADRYGSKPVMLMGVALTLILPMGWLVMPRASELSLIIAFSLAFVQGIASLAWGIGSGRLLFVRIVPTQHKSEYMAVFYAAIGLIGGFSQIIGGGLIDAFSDLSGQFLFITLDSYTMLMIISIVLPALSIILFTKLVSDSEVTVTEFAGFFMHGNPVSALETMVRFYRAKSEKSVVLLTERLGQIKSPLTVNEMLDALSDPRFNVRFEAIISIARMNPQPKLTKALIQVVNGTELALSAMATWALGRMGDKQAIPALRDGLDSEYKSIRAHSARALGTLGDTQVIPILLNRLQVEDNKALKIAYASTLANLHATSAINSIFKVMAQVENNKARMELATSLTRMVDGEHHFVNLLRQVHSDAGTAIAQELIYFKNHLKKGDQVDNESLVYLKSATDAFEQDDFAAGIQALINLLEGLPSTLYDEVATELLRGCLKGLRQWRFKNIENVVLALTILNVG